MLKYLQVCVYEVVQICQVRAQGAPLHQPNERTTERQVKEDSKRPRMTLEVWKSSAAEMRATLWLALTPGTERDSCCRRQLLLTPQKFGFFFGFNFYIFHILTPEFSLQREHAGDADDWQRDVVVCAVFRGRMENNCRNQMCRRDWDLSN